jgi:hypothetical protein
LVPYLLKYALGFRIQKTVGEVIDGGLSAELSQHMRLLAVVAEGHPNDVSLDTLVELAGVAAEEEMYHLDYPDAWSNLGQALAERGVEVYGKTIVTQIQRNGEGKAVRLETS